MLIRENEKKRPEKEGERTTSTMLGKKKNPEMLI
jgi:hypothetical protein